MTKILTAIVCAFLISCGNNRNELMTKLINDKSALQDSITEYSYKEKDFYSKAKSSMHDTDTTLWHKLADTSTQFFMAGIHAKDKLQRIDFSIDSLSKMK